ncbi:ATP12 family chaperone protein [Zavarzinia sp. CC-PAN008]|uniref:ATP12 family chaperone protein n=1 Tax=Zavarzinia sp. CC-PAN008 TaxID=3243332 RepID=UPI003F74406A
MKRTYKQAAFVPVEGGFAIQLDGKGIKTPARASLVVPTEAIAQGIAEEWNAQGETVRPAALPLTRLANTALDRVPLDPERVIDEVAAYAGTDLLCYRAEAPDVLVARQAMAWDPVLDWLAGQGARLAVAQGVSPVDQDPAALARVRAMVGAHDAFGLVGLHALTGALGSVVLALALAQERLDLAAAWAASRIDEDYQVELWGRDEEATARTEALWRDTEAAERFFRLSRQA